MKIVILTCSLSNLKISHTKIIKTDHCHKYLSSIHESLGAWVLIWLSFEEWVSGISTIIFPQEPNSIYKSISITLLGNCLEKTAKGTKSVCRKVQQKMEKPCQLKCFQSCEWARANICCIRPSKILVCQIIMGRLSIRSLTNTDTVRHFYKLKSKEGLKYCFWSE